MKAIRLANGVEIPAIAYGTWKLEKEMTASCVKDAIECGYRHIDSAESYYNQKEAGQGVYESGIEREKLFLTSKTSNDVSSYEETIRRFEKTLKDFRTDYLDLLLIHWPNPLAFRDDYLSRDIEIYHAYEDLYRQGRVRSIGVSNFEVHHLEELKQHIEIPVMVNQIEYHPYYYDKETIDYCLSNGIVVESYSTLGRGKILNDEKLAAIGSKYDKTVAQVCVRYAIQRDIVALPKSTNKERIRQNIEIDDFELSDEDMEFIDGLSHYEGKLGSRPDTALF